MTGKSNTAKSINRILLECTETYYTDRNTGIERVVRNIAKISSNVGWEVGVECKPIVRQGEDFVAVPWKPRAGHSKLSLARIAKSIAGTPETWQQTTLGRVAIRCGTRLRKLFYPRSLVRKVSKIWAGKRRPIVVPGAGDTLVLLDAWWNPDTWPKVAEARRNGAKIGVVIYDLLPITNPEFFRPDVTVSFALCLKQVLAQGDFFITISDTVCETLREYAMQYGPRRMESASFMSFRLGSTLDMLSHKKKPRESLRRAFTGDAESQPYLTVGTLEPRKNHTLLLDAFDHIWEDNPETRLVIVGRVGWLCESLIDRIMHHPLYQKSLFLFSDLSDSELEYCYRHAKALLFPSHAEGFGLPVAEALRHGLPVMASDIPIHREVGRDFCMYFDKRTHESLCELIHEFQGYGQPLSMRKPEEFDVPDWNVSTHEFIRKCVDASQPRVEAEVHTWRRAA